MLQLHGAPDDLYVQHVIRDAFVRFDAGGALDVAYVEQWVASDWGYCAPWECREPKLPEDGIVVRTLLERDPTAAARASSWWESSRWYRAPGEGPHEGTWGWKTTVAEHRTPDGGKRYLAAWQEPVALEAACHVLRPGEPDYLDLEQKGDLWGWHIPEVEWILAGRTALPLLVYRVALGPPSPSAPS